jgi:hypothetical protein
MTRNIANMTGIDQNNFKVVFLQYVINRLPVNIPVLSIAM